MIVKLKHNKRPFTFCLNVTHTHTHNHLPILPIVTFPLPPFATIGFSTFSKQIVHLGIPWWEYFIYRCGRLRIVTNFLGVYFPSPWMLADREKDPALISRPKTSEKTSTSCLLQHILLKPRCHECEKAQAVLQKGLHLEALVDLPPQKQPTNYQANHLKPHWVESSCPCPALLKLQIHEPEKIIIAVLV